MKIDFTVVLLMVFWPLALGLVTIFAFNTKADRADAFICLVLQQDWKKAPLKSLKKVLLGSWGILWGARPAVQLTGGSSSRKVIQPAALPPGQTEFAGTEAKLPGKTIEELAAELDISVAKYLEVMESARSPALSLERRQYDGVSSDIPRSPHTAFTKKGKRAAAKIRSAFES